MPFSFNKKRAPKKGAPPIDEKRRRPSSDAPPRRVKPRARACENDLLALASVRAKILDEIYCDKFAFSTEEFAEHAGKVVLLAAGLVDGEASVDVPLSAVAALDEGFDDLAGVTYAASEFRTFDDAVAAALKRAGPTPKRRALEGAIHRLSARLAEYSLADALAASSAAASAGQDVVGVDHVVVASAPTPKRRASSSDFLDAVFAA